MAKRKFKSNTLFLLTRIISVILIALMSCDNSDSESDCFDKINNIDISTIEIPKKDDVISSIKKANDYWLQHGDIGDSHWNKAVYYSAELDLFELTLDSAYLFHALKWAKINKFSLVKDKGEEIYSIRNADKQCCGQAYFKLHRVYKNDSIIKDITLCIKSMLFDNNDEYWTWIDAYYMAMPVFVVTGNYKKDNFYFEKMYDLFSYTKYNLELYGDNYLWYRDVKYLPKNNRTQNGQPVQWSRGNGWVYAALAKTLDKLPTDAQGREDYLNTFQQMSKAIIQQQRKDGFWNRNLSDPLDYPGPETSGTALFAFGLAWGINNGILTEPIYWNAVSKAWHALESFSLKESGFLGYVQPQASEPGMGGIDISKNTEDFGVGVFLSAGCEISKLESKFDSIKFSH